MNNPLTRVLLLSSFGAYTFLYVPSVVLLALDIKYANSEWVGSLLLTLAGVSAVMWVVVNRGLRRGLGFAGAVLLLSFIVEYLGVSSGLVFGPYQYTTVLTPLLFTVPLAIPFAWLTVVLAAWCVANAVLAQFNIQNSTFKIVFAGLLTMLLDLLIEPVAVYVSGYWLWQRGGIYYGIPTQNFIAWAVIGGLMALVAAWFIGNPMPRPAYAFLPPTLYLMNALLFGVVAIAHGYVVTGLLAVVGIALGGRALLGSWPRALSQPPRQERG